MKETDNIGNLVISPSHYFRLVNGQILKSVDELAEAVERIDHSVFHAHVTPFKNDFAKWIYDVFMDKTLSGMLGNVKSKEETGRILRAYLKQKIKGRLQYRTMQAQDTISQTGQNLGLNHVQEPIRDTRQDHLQPLNKISHKVYIFRNSESVSLESRKKPEGKKLAVVDEKKEKIKDKEPEAKEEKKPEEEKHIEPEIKKEPEKIKVKPLPSPSQKREIVEDINSPDEFFEKNPILVSQRVEARKKTLSLEPLELFELKGDETQKQKAELFKEAYSRAYQRLSLQRKSGYDTSLAEIMLFRIPAKIKIFEASGDKKDALLVERYLKEIIEELNNMS